MVVSTIAYGIRITDNFGAPLGGLETLVSAVKAAMADNCHLNNLPWLASCPSERDHQLILGLTARIGKSTDFDSLHAQWKTAWICAPDSVKDIAHELGLSGPDVHFLAGSC